MNRLADETSPYLLQHAHNPVDWYPWGPEALERARREDRPILISIGYAACHWCHVMERESFENAETARLMNELFVSIKVDREERPDLDAIYMSAVQAMTGQGGWPMTVFLTPEGVPYHGGTYYPPVDRHGMPSFTRVMRAASDAYRLRRGDVERLAGQVRELYAHAADAAQSTGTVDEATLQRAVRSIAQRFDARNGGFEGAPKFPQAMTLDFLLRQSQRTAGRMALEIAQQSFRAMARGGIYDQLGGGFHRYSVDAHWLVPHFEKMLYDNALLIQLGAHLWQATRDEEARRVTEETVEWVTREMTSPAGGFYSSLDADSEGKEGRFYVWSLAEVQNALGPLAPVAAAYWDVTPGGNFEGHNILHVPNPPGVVAARLGLSVEAVAEQITTARAALARARAQRVRPGRDDKILASWNGLMLRAVAGCARVFGHEQHRRLALANAEFLFAELVHDGRVLRTHTAGVSRIAGYLEDYAAVALGFLAVYELTFDRQWLDRARLLADSMQRWFWDDDIRAFYDTARDQEALIARPREVTDNATPSGTSLAAELLARLGDLLDDAPTRERARWVIESLAEPVGRYPTAFGHLLGVADFAVHGPVEVALAGDPASTDFQSLARAVADAYLPALVLAGGQGEATAGVALLRDRVPRDGRATAYVCRQFRCDAPVTTVEELRPQLPAQPSSA